MVTHVLLDGDGVLQRHPRGWVEAAEVYVGDRAAAFFVEVTEQERACLTGGQHWHHADGLPRLHALLAGHGIVPGSAPPSR